MSFILIAIGIVVSVLIWPVNRWVNEHGGRPAVYGFWLCLTGAVFSGITVAVTGQSLAVPAIWLSGAAIGIAFAVGFCLVVMYCLRIGPAGPTVVMNNMGMVWPVLLGAFWPHPHSPNALMLAGVALVVLALIGFGLSRPHRDATGNEKPVTEPHPQMKKASARWAFWAFVGFCLSGISQSSQLIGSTLAPSSSVGITFVYTSVATLVLTPIVIGEWRRARKAGRAMLNWRETAGGIGNGAMLAVSQVAVLTVLTMVGPELVFPFTVAAPMIVVLFIGQYLYHERLDRIGWMACILGTAGLLALSIGQGA